MKLNMLVDEDTAGDYDYKSSIATQTYDKIKLSYENKETGKREIYIAQDGSHINQWGVLQYYEKLDSKANARRWRTLSWTSTTPRPAPSSSRMSLVTSVWRAGTAGWVGHAGPGCINDVQLPSWPNRSRHTFNDGQHLMELKMRGGTFVA